MGKMYELIQLGDRSYYFQSPAKIGLVRLNDKDVCLIDSGNDKDAGKKVLRVIKEQGWELRAVYNTHSHADHIGGNKYLQGQTGCAVYAPGIECDLTAHPVLEPAFLYGGYPCKDLRHKFLMAQESRAEMLTEEALPQGLSPLPLPGHSFDMVGFRSSDDVVYLADCLSSRETLDKYGIGFIYDVGAYLDTLEKVKAMQARLFVPSHAEVCESIAELARYNIDKVREISGHITELCASPRSFESLLQQLFADYAMTMSFEQYALVGSTVRSYLSWLKDSGKLRVIIEDNCLLWAAEG